MSAPEPSGQDKAEKRRSCLKGCVIALAVPLFLLIVLLFILLYEPHYTHFGKHRTGEMEEIFGFSVTDDMCLDEYRFISGWLCEDEEMLTVSGIKDYRRFMANNINGEIILKCENGIEYDYRTNTQSKSRYSEDMIRFEYTIPGAEYSVCTIYVQFEAQENDTYKAVFEKYT